MDLDFFELGGLPSLRGHAGAVGIQIHQEGLDEVVLDDALVGFFVVGVADDIEDAGPEELFELDVLIPGGEEGLPGADLLALLLGIEEVHLGVELVVGGVVEDGLQEAHVIGGLPLHEEGVAAHARHHVVNQDAQLIPQTLVVQLVPILQHPLERLPQRQNNFLGTGHAVDGFLPFHLDQVPDGLDGDVHNVRTEVWRLR
mmetsp:Transcript_1188/g.1195  ORF Transcript_1188/g.1195 Transcript_1188/m.1195 type:complete len:200 (-) Transcript_1188:710-1309(-)